MRWERNQQTIMNVTDRNEAEVLQIVVRRQGFVVQIHLPTSFHTLIGYNAKLILALALVMLVYQMGSFMRTID